MFSIIGVVKIYLDLFNKINKIVPRMTRYHFSAFDAVPIISRSLRALTTKFTYMDSYDVGLFCRDLLVEIKKSCDERHSTDFLKFQTTQNFTLSSQNFQPIYPTEPFKIYRV